MSSTSNVIVIIIIISSMSFLSIPDPKRRDALVREYATSLETIRQRNRHNRLQTTSDKRELAKIFSPVVKASEAVSTTVSKEINPLKRDMQLLTDSIKENTREQKRVKTETYPDQKRIKTEAAGGEDEQGQQQSNNIAYYYLKTKTTGKDNVYGIFTNSDGKLQMGNKNVFIQDNNIIVGDVTYEGTEGLWSLVMDTKPKPSLYTNRDVDHYKELLQHTNVAFEPNTTSSKRRPRSSTKWKQTIEPLILEDKDFFEEKKESQKHHDGKGICGHQLEKKQLDFLPGDVPGLQSKMKLLLAEFLAGNKTTRNELVRVLDELKRRGKISKKDYTQTNALLAST